MIINEDWWSGADVPSSQLDWIHVIGVDPGETTGLFSLCVPVRLLNRRGSRVMEPGGLDSHFLNISQVRRDVSFHPSFFMVENMQVRSIMDWINVEHLRLTHDSSIATDRLGTYIACEDFLLRERTSDRNLLSPVRLTSLLMDKLDDWSLEVSVHVQSPSDKSIVSDQQLRGVWAPGQPHAMDAARHVNLFLRKATIR